jgi:predicted membrane metal-binding protein
MRKQFGTFALFLLTLFVVAPSAHAQMYPGYGVNPYVAQANPYLLGNQWPGSLYQYQQPQTLPIPGLPSFVQATTGQMPAGMIDQQSYQQLWASNSLNWANATPLGTSYMPAVGMGAVMNSMRGNQVLGSGSFY